LVSLVRRIIDQARGAPKMGSNLLMVAEPLDVMWFAAAWIWMGCALLSGTVAQSKGRDGPIWIALGAMFGMFALIAIAGMTTVPEEDDAKEHVEAKRQARRANTRSSRR
jgi:hypothetical protein